MSGLVPTRGQFLVYRDEASKARIDVRLDDETVWLTQAQLVKTLASSEANIGEHIKNVTDRNRLQTRTVRDFRTVHGDRTHKDCLSVRPTADPAFSDRPPNGGQQDRRNARPSGRKAGPSRRPLSVRHASLRTTVSTIGKRWQLREEASDGAL